MAPTPKARPSPKTGARPTERNILERAEEAGERFDEACDHAQRRREFSSLQLGPSLPLPMSRLAAGRLGWSRQVTLGAASAQIYFLLDPAPSRAAGPKDPLPVLDLVRSTVVVDLRAPGGSPERTLGIAPDRKGPKGFAALVAAVHEELRSDSG